MCHISQYNCEWRVLRSLFKVYQDSQPPAHGLLGSKGNSKNVLSKKKKNQILPATNRKNELSLSLDKDYNGEMYNKNHSGRFRQIIHAYSGIFWNYSAILRYI